jgi:hypothetical protein
VLAVWQRTLRDITYADADRFLGDWILDEVFPPDPAEIRRGVRQKQRDAERERKEAETRARYRVPALGEGWMTRAKASTATNAEITAHVVGLAEAWGRGELDLAGVRGLCDGWERFVALNHDKAAVLPLIEELAADDDARSGNLVTKHGTFTPQDVRENGGICGPINGRDVLRWPTSGSPGRWRYGEVES